MSIVWIQLSLSVLWAYFPRIEILGVIILVQILSLIGNALIYKNLVRVAVKLYQHGQERSATDAWLRNTVLLSSMIFAANGMWMVSALIVISDLASRYNEHRVFQLINTVKQGAKQ